jgi:hypothetical protein
MVSVVIESVSHYLPMLSACQVRNVRISITHALHLNLSAEFQSNADAARVQTCVANVGGSTPELRYVSALLGRGAVEPGKARARLDMGVTSDEISRLLDELCWALRRVGV